MQWDLTISNPTRVGLPYDEALILDALQRREVLRYEPDPRGLSAARAAVAQYYRERNVSQQLDELILTASTSEAYAHLFRLLCNAGEVIHVPRPSYPLFPLLAELQDVHLVSYPLIYDHGWQLDRSGLLDSLNEKSRAILVVNPNNPTGSYTSQADWEWLEEVAAAHHLALIEDEVFHDYPLEVESGKLPLAGHAGQGTALKFVLNGLSKICGLPQMKLGWVAVSGPPALKKEALDRLEVINDTFLSVDTPVQWAAAALLGSRRGFQSALLERLRSNLAQIDEVSARSGYLSRLRVEGGWSAVLRLPAVCTDQEWAARLLREEGVLVHPGHFYDFSEEARLVISLLPQPELLCAGMEALARCVQRYCA